MSTKLTCTDTESNFSFRDYATHHPTYVNKYTRDKNIYRFRGKFPKPAEYEGKGKKKKNACVYGHMKISSHRIRIQIISPFRSGSLCLRDDHQINESSYLSEADVTHQVCHQLLVIILTRSTSGGRLALCRRRVMHRGGRSSLSRLLEHRKNIWRKTRRRWRCIWHTRLGSLCRLRRRGHSIRVRRRRARVHSSLRWGRRSPWHTLRWIVRRHCWHRRGRWRCPCSRSTRSSRRSRWLLQRRKQFLHLPCLLKPVVNRLFIMATKAHYFSTMF